MERKTRTGELIMEGLMALAALGLMLALMTNRSAPAHALSKKDIKICEQVCERSGGLAELDQDSCTCADGAVQVWGKR